MKSIINHLDEKKRERLGEISRFAVVGIAATAIQAATYCLLVEFIHYGVANTLGYAISFIFNYIASTKYTFRVKSTAKRGAGFMFSHAVNYMLQTASLSFFVWMGCDKRMALVPMFCICVPVNFILVRYFLKKR